MKHCRIATIVLLILSCVACNHTGDYTFATLYDAEPGAWAESAPVIIAQDTLHATIQNGELRIGSGEWLRGSHVLSLGDTLTLRVKSSDYPDDMAMCCLLMNNAKYYFSAQTKNFEIPDTLDGARYKHLGISGPDHAALGGPSPLWLKYNTRNTKLTGSAVKQGLIPDIKPLIDAQIRDAVICVGGDSCYYLTGSTGNDIWHANDGVELWKSRDLKQWEYMGLVWSFEQDATWQQWRFHKKAVRALWAPELHYIKGNYYITLSMPPGDRGLLKSTTGRPEGPYINALADDGYWATDIDASLFEDEDGSVYLVYGGGFIARMKEDMSGLAEEPVKPVLLDPDTIPSHHAATCATRRDCKDIGREGAFLFKRDGIYYLTAADSYEGRYSSMVAISESIYGPYRMRHEAVPCGGGTGYFRDHDGQWWCSFFGNDNQAPFREMPAIVPIDFAPDGKIFVVK